MAHMKSSALKSKITVLKKSSPAFMDLYKNRVMSHEKTPLRMAIENLKSGDACHTTDPISRVHSVVNELRRNTKKRMIVRSLKDKTALVIAL